MKYSAVKHRKDLYGGGSIYNKEDLGEECTYSWPKFSLQRSVYSLELFSSSYIRTWESANGHLDTEN